MIYLDTSVALAYLLAEDRRPNDSQMATYDERMRAGAEALGLELYPID